MKTILNENIIRNLIKESLLSLFESTKIPSMATRGNFKGESCLKLLQDIPSNIISKITDGSKSLPDWKKDKKGFLGIFGDKLIYKIYLQYKNAIETKKDNRGNPIIKATNFYLFISRLLNGFHGLPMTYYEKDGSYLIGANSMGCWLAAYFAPLGKIGMYNLIYSLCEYDNIVFAVTDNLASMLEKLGLPKLNDKVICKFKGSQCNKEIFGTTIEAAKKGSKIVQMTNIDITKILNGDKDAINFLSSNPDVVTELMKMQQVSSVVKGNAKNLVSLVTKNPQLLKNFI